MATDTNINHAAIVDYKDANGKTRIKWGEKAAAFSKICIKGVRWFNRRDGQTLMRAYISGLDTASNTWVDLGVTRDDCAYGEHYIVLGCEWLNANGYIEASDSYALSSWVTRDQLGGIELHSQDVTRKKDM